MQVLYHSAQDLFCEQLGRMSDFKGSEQAPVPLVGGRGQQAKTPVESESILFIYSFQDSKKWKFPQTGFQTLWHNQVKSGQSML